MSEPVQAAWPELHRVRKAIVVVDVFESVRLVEVDEAGFVRRWRLFLHEVSHSVLADSQGRLVKSLGDGLLLQFDTVPQAVDAAQRMLGLWVHGNRGLTADQAVLLRVGIHIADIVVDAIDVFGAGVNLAARVAAMAEPGSIYLTADARDELAPGLDPDVEDLGERFGKHLSQPVHVFRLLTGGIARPEPPRQPEEEQPRASVAVIPFACTAGSASDAVLGDWMADAVIAQLTRTPELTVYSRLASAPLRGRVIPASEAGASIGARYLLNGSYARSGARLVWQAELCLAANGEVLWAERASCAMRELLQEPCAPLEHMAQCVHRAILEREARRVLMQPLPSLEAFSLLYGGIGLLHRSTAQDFRRAQEALLSLSERVPRHSSAHAWLAKWHCLRIIRGQAPHGGEDGPRAKQHIADALERNPDSALAWALNALVSAWVDRSLPAAQRACEEALARNPHEAMAWLFRCAVHSWLGEGEQAASAGRRALELSRLDPMRYYFQTLSAAGFLAAGRYEDAVMLCELSLRQNRLHTPTHRVLAISQMLAGQDEAASATVAAMLRLQPDYTVRQYLENYPGGAVPHARRYAEALQAAGLPH